MNRAWSPATGTGRPGDDEAPVDLGNRASAGLAHHGFELALEQLQHHLDPGHMLAVFQQGKYDEQQYGDFQFNRDFGGVFSAPSHNVFLVKFSYWLNM